MFRELLHSLDSKTGMMAILALIVLVILWTLARKSRSSSSGFSFDDLLLDETGRASKPAAVMFGSFALTTWTIAYLTVVDKLTEAYFGLYIGAWVVPVVAKIMKGESPSAPQSKP